jgi:hypothetical protein
MGEVCDNTTRQESVTGSSSSNYGVIIIMYGVVVLLYLILLVGPLLFPTEYDSPVLLYTSKNRKGKRREAGGLKFMAIVGELEPGTKLLDYESLNEIDCSSGIHLTGEKSPDTESVMVPDTPSSHAP